MHCLQRDVYVLKKTQVSSGKEVGKEVSRENRNEISRRSRLFNARSSQTQPVVMTTRLRRTRREEERDEG